MGPVQIVGQGFFPLDEELALQPGSLTPKLQEHLAHLGSWMPFARAAHMLERLLGVQISEPTVRRGTERAGALYEALQTVQSQMLVSVSPTETGCERQVISADGAYVPLVGGEWGEALTVAIGEVKHEPKAGVQDVQICHLSYFSRMTDAETFAELAEVEMRRRGVSQAKVVGAVTDGAPWLQASLICIATMQCAFWIFPMPPSISGCWSRPSRKQRFPSRLRLSREVYMCLSTVVLVCS
jgi:hypothetical protein